MAEETVSDAPEELLMITNGCQKLFDWDVDQTDDSISVRYELPESVDPSTITVKLNETKTSVTIEMPEQPPLLCGRLSFPVGGVTREAETGVFVVSFAKLEPVEWELVVTGVHEETGGIDPKSAFALFCYLDQGGRVSTDDGTDSLVFLNRSARAGFLSAIRMLVSLGLGSDDAELQLQGLAWLERAADRYDDLSSMVRLGCIMATTPGREEDGVQYLERAAVRGDRRANDVLGLMYSPYCSLFESFERKDAALAVQYFSRGGGERRAVKALVKIYERGAEGVPKDLEKAQQLRELLDELEM